MAQEAHAPPRAGEALYDGRRQGAEAGRGWLEFSAMLFIAAGLANGLYGIAALVNDDYFRADELLFGDLAVWGVVYLLFGAVMFGVGLLILNDKGLGIVAGSIIALLHGCAALMSIGAYPLWTVIVLVIDGLILSGLIVHGRPGAEASR
jgi:hypothetical protein